MLIERLKLLRIAWQLADQDSEVFQAVVDGLKLQLKVLSANRFMVIHGLSEIEIEEWPTRWTLQRPLKTRLSS